MDCLAQSVDRPLSTVCARQSMDCTSWAWPDLCVNGRSGVKPIPGFVLAARNLAAPIRLQYSSIQTADYVIGYSMLARILFAMDVNRFIC